MIFLCDSRIFLCELAVDSLFDYLAVLTLDSDEHDKNICTLILCVIGASLPEFYKPAYYRIHIIIDSYIQLVFN